MRAGPSNSAANFFLSEKKSISILTNIIQRANSPSEKTQTKKTATKYSHMHWQCDGRDEFYFVLHLLSFPSFHSNLHIQLFPTTKLELNLRIKVGESRRKREKVDDCCKRTLGLSRTAWGNGSNLKKKKLALRKRTKKIIDRLWNKTIQ